MSAEELDDADELAAGGERDPVRVPRWLSVLGVAAVVAAAGYVALRPADEAPPQGGPSSASPSAADSPAPTGYPPLEGPMVLADRARLTLGRDRLTFVFCLQNNISAPVTVLSVSAHLPIGGLTPLGGRVPAEGGCRGDAGGGDRSTTLNPADRIPVSLSFQRFDDCPAPYPVQVDVAVEELDGIRTQRLAVLPDLGMFTDDFPACDRG